MTFYKKKTRRDVKQGKKHCYFFLIPIPLFFSKKKGNMHRDYPHCRGPRGCRGCQGSQGFDGYRGPQGPRGIQGNNTDAPFGPQGYQGTQGDLGYQGEQGTQGFPWYVIRGFQGAKGEDYYGPQGWQGPQGERGSQGIVYQDDKIGWQGLIGEKGVQGFDGEQGVQGYQGPLPPDPIFDPRGAQGLEGQIGPDQTIYFQGPQGPQGNQGQMQYGPQGKDGLFGPSAIIEDGFQGSQGSQGMQGFQAADGGIGPIGPQGYQGDIGPTASLVRNFSESKDLFVTITTFSQITPVFLLGKSAGIVPLWTLQPPLSLGSGLFFVTYEISLFSDPGIDIDPVIFRMLLNNVVIQEKNIAFRGNNVSLMMQVDTMIRPLQDTFVVDWQVPNNQNVITGSQQRLFFQWIN